MGINHKKLRRESLKAAQLLGYPPATVLPLADDLMEPRPIAEIADRFLALCGIVATSSFGLDRSKAWLWLEREGVWGSLTDEEQRFILHGADNLNDFQVRTEARWALAWVLGLVNDLDFGAYNRDHYDADVPTIWENEPTAAWRAGLRCRSFEEIAAACDLGYCIHWAIRDADLNGREIPGAVRTYVIRQRRHALEWVLNIEDWDNISLNT
jgi:hypothetical protein